MYFGSYSCITEHILVLRILYLYYGAYSCISDLIHVLRNLYFSFGTYTCVTELIRVFRILYGAYSCIKVPVGTTQIHYTEVPVGTTGLILILQNLYLLYRYGSTRWYYRDFTCTKILVGTIEHILIQRYP